MKKPHLLLLLLGAGGLIACGAWFLTPRSQPVEAPSVVSYTEQATQLAKAGQVTEAVVQFNRAIAMAPRDSEPYIGLAVLYESLNRPDLAIETLEQLQAANPKARHLTCRLAEAHLGAESMKTAKELAEKAVKEEPDSPRAYSVCGLTMMAFRYYDTAATMLQKAYQLAPEDSEIAQALLDVYLKQGQYAKATELGEQIVTKSPDAPRLHYLLGWGYGRLTDRGNATEQAIAHLQKASELAPQWFEPYAELGRLYKSIGKREEALRRFEQAWKINANSPGVAYNLADLWRQRGDPRAGTMQQTYRRLLEGKERFTQLRLHYKFDTANPARVMSLAESEARNGLFGTALQRLRTLLSVQPDNVEALRLYIRLDTLARAPYPNYLRPGPGIGLPRA